MATDFWSEYRRLKKKQLEDTIDAPVKETTTSSSSDEGSVFWDEYRKNKKDQLTSTATETAKKEEKEKEEKKAEQKTLQKSTSTTSPTSDKLVNGKLMQTQTKQVIKEDGVSPGDIAPVKTHGGAGGGFGDATDGKNDSWIKKSEGNLWQTILGSGTDLTEHVTAGAIGVGEKIVDALTTVGTLIGQTSLSQTATDEMLYNAIHGKEDENVLEKYEGVKKESEKKSAEFIAKDLYDEEAIAKIIISDPMRRKYGINSEGHSIFGEKSDELAMSAGQLGVQIGVNALLPGSGIVMMGATTFGSEAESAFRNGATFGEAVLSASISTAAEVLTERIGGVKFGGKTLSDAVFGELSSKVTGKFARALVAAGKLATDASFEAAEGVVSGYISAWGQTISYMDDKEIEELFSKEDALDAAIGGFVLGGVFSVGEAAITGRDPASGLTKNEQAVVDKEVERRVAEQEKGGKKLTTKEIGAIKKQVQDDMEHGQLDIEMIEEVLGGDSYTAYKDTVKSEDGLKAEYEQLANIKKSDLTTKQEERLAELKAMNLGDTTKRDDLRKKLNETVFPQLKDSKLAESYNQVAKKGEAFKADLSKYKGKQREAVERAMKSGVLNDTFRSHELVDILSKIEAEKGIVFDYTNNAKLKESGFAVDGKTVNGYANKKQGSVTLNVQSAKAWQSVVGHEITHVLETNPEAYKALRESLYAYAESRGELESRRAETTALYDGMDADIEAELTADLVGDYLFTDKNFVNKLAGNRTLFQKVRDEITYLWNVATGKEKTEIEKVKDEFDRVWKEYGKEKVQETESKEYSDADLAYSISPEADADYMSAVERGDTETAQMMVDEAAKNAGYTPEHLYHGTSGFGFTKIDTDLSDDGISFFVADNIEVAQGYFHYYEDDYDKYHDSVRAIGKASNRAKAPLNEKLSTTEVISKAKETMPDEYGNAKPATDQEVISYLNEYWIPHAVSAAEELKRYSIPKNVENLVDMVINANSEGTYESWKAVAHRYQDFANIYEISYNGQYFAQASAFWEKVKSGVQMANKVLSHDAVNVNGEIIGKNVLVQRYNDHLAGEGNGVYDLYAKHDKQLVIRGRGSNWNDLPLGEATKDFNDWWVNEEGHEPSVSGQWYRADTRSIAKYAKARGYRSVRFDDIYDAGAYGDRSEISTVYAFFHPKEDIKSADTVTYDDMDRVIPLSKRFNAENEDIRYSLSNEGEYSDIFYSHMGKVLDGVKQDKLGASSVIPMLKGKGVKSEEIKWSGIEQFLEGKKSVTKAELQEFASANQLHIEESLHEGGARVTLERSPYGDDSWDVMLGGSVLDTYSWREDSKLYESDNVGGGFSTTDRILNHFKKIYGSGDTRWGQYKLDGGENYRELIFKMPDSSYSNDAMEVHWGEEGILAHARIQDMYTEFGGSMLFVEEIQSDWHNAGHKNGYTDFVEKEATVANTSVKLIDGRYVLCYRGKPLDKAVSISAEFAERRGYDNGRIHRGLVNGFNRDREYDSRTPDAPFRDNYHEYAIKRLIRMAAEGGYDSIGWTTADIQSKRWSNEYAEGYRIEYDQDIPKFLNKYGKQWGTSVGKTKTADGDEVWSMPITEEMKQSVLYEGQPMYSLSNEDESYAPVGNYSTPFRELALDAPVADVADNNVGNIGMSDNVAPIPVEEEETVVQDAPVDDIKITTAKERIGAKLSNTQTEIDRNNQLRAEAKAGYDEKIAALQKLYDGKKNKDTKTANNILRRIERLRRLSGNVDADYAKRISDLEGRRTSLSDQMNQDHTKADRLELAYARIDRDLEQRMAELDSEFAQRRAEMEESLADRNAFISAEAGRLYDELASLRKGVRASKELGYLLDHGFDWKSLKAALVNVKRSPGEAWNVESEVEPLVREAIAETYDARAAELEGLDSEYAQEVERLKADAETYKTAAREQAEALRRADVQRQKLDEVNSILHSRGFDLDDMLDNPERQLSTLETVDTMPQRVMEKTFGYEAGQALSDATVNKIAQNETAGLKWLDSITNRKNGLLAQLSKQYHIKPHSKEVAAAMMYGEGSWVDEKTGEEFAYGDAELAKDFPDVRVQNNIKALVADPRIRQFYDETLDAINAERKANGYPEIPKRANYFLHYREMGDFFTKHGLPFNPNDMRAKDLPTDMVGRTADLKPGQPYFSSSMQRKGKKTSYDLFEGIERYANSAKNQIFHIGDIQTLRALHYHLAERFGKAQGLENLNKLTPEQASEQIKKVYGSHLSTFAAFLDTEANILAGKTSMIDRALSEGVLGRRILTFMDTLNKQTGAALIGYSASSPNTNWLPVVREFANANPVDSVKALAQTVANIASRGKFDSFREDSTVYIRRRGADRFNRKLWQKLQDPGYAFMGAVDSIGTEIIARTEYNKAIREGMSAQEAHYESDKKVSRLMADRSLGQMPQMYTSRMMAILTKFQLEVRNDLDSMFYDTLQEEKLAHKDIENTLERNAKTAAKVAWRYGATAIALHMFGQAFESVAGYNPAFDIIEAISKAFGWDDDEDDEDTWSDNLGEGAMSLLEDLPYANIFLDGGRVPISSALPDVKGIITGKDEYGNEKSRLKTVLEVAPYMLPAGGNQIKKTVQGLKMFSDDHPVSGSYTDSGNLRFPVEDTVPNRIQAALFGQWANENARDYIENKRKALSPKQVDEYVSSEMTIGDYWDYREGLSGLSKIEEKAAYINGLDIPVWKKNLLINNLTDRKDPISMEEYATYGSIAESDFAKDNPARYELLKRDGVTYEQYQAFDDSKKNAYSWAAKNPEKYEFIERLGYTVDDYAEASDDEKDAWTWAYNNPEKYEVSKAITGDLFEYRQYKSELNDIGADKDSSGKSISGSRKEKVIDYINSLDADYGEKLVLFKSEYPADDTYNNEIIDYLNGRDDLTYEQIVIILKELGFKVSGNDVTW